MLAFLGLKCPDFLCILLHWVTLCVFFRPSGLLAQERKLCRDLVHSNKKEQEFRSIFQHIQSAQSQRSPSELFAQHIVTIVHHVKGES